MEPTGGLRKEENPGQSSMELFRLSRRKETKRTRGWRRGGLKRRLDTQ